MVLVHLVQYQPAVVELAAQTVQHLFLVLVAQVDLVVAQAVKVVPHVLVAAGTLADIHQ